MYIYIYIFTFEHIKQMPTFNALLKYMVKKSIIYLKVQIFLFFSESLSM